MHRRDLFTLALAGLTLAAPGVLRAGEPAEANAVRYESRDQLRQLAAKGPTVVYFHAEWCPTCKATMVNFRGRWNEVKPGLTLVLADYDADIELKTEYGVTYQNTFVQVGADGSRLKIWNGGGIEALNEKTVF